MTTRVSPAPPGLTVMLAVETTTPLTPDAIAKNGSKIFISTSLTISSLSRLIVWEMTPKGPRVPATGRPAVNLNSCDARSSPPGSIFWNPQKNGDDLNASTDAYTSAHSPSMFLAGSSVGFMNSSSVMISSMVALASRLACWPRLEAAARPRSLRMSLDRSSASGSSSGSSSGAGGGGAGASAFGSSFFGDVTSGCMDAASGLETTFSGVSFMRSSLVNVMGSALEPSFSSTLSARGVTSEAERADRGLAAMVGAIAARRVESGTREDALGRTCARVDATSAMPGGGRVSCSGPEFCEPPDPDRARQGFAPVESPDFGSLLTRVPKTQISGVTSP